MSFAYIGSFIALLMFMPLVNFFSEKATGNRSVEYGWIMAVAVISIICIILFFLTFALTRERVKPVRTQSKASEDLKDLMKNRPWWLLLGAGVAALIFNSIRDGATVYYFKYYIQEESISNISLFNFSFVLSGLYLAIGQIANLAGVILSAPLSNKIGKKNTYIGSMAIATILSIIFFWISKDNLIWIFIFQVLISICAGSIFPLLWSMYADCADYSEYKTGNRATGLIFSSSSMSQKLGWAIGSALTGWLLAYFGFQANTAQNPETIQGIKMFMSLLPAIGTVLSVILISFYPLSEKKMRKISIALQERRDNDAIK
jgi:GPH family glycoside/pentoside/hexuronide:cation symporter